MHGSGSVAAGAAVVIAGLPYPAAALSPVLAPGDLFSLLLRLLFGQGVITFRNSEHVRRPPKLVHGAQEDGERSPVRWEAGRVRSGINCRGSVRVRLCETSQEN